MKAAVTNEQHGFDVVEIARPAPGPDELVIRVAACGVCGSDIKAQPFMPARAWLWDMSSGARSSQSDQTAGNGRRVPMWQSYRLCRVVAVDTARWEPYRIARKLATSGWVPRRWWFRRIRCCASAPCIRAARRHASHVRSPWSSRSRSGLHGVNSAEIRPGEDVLVVGAGGVGRPELLQSCQAVVRPQGRIVISGACAEPTPIEPVTALLKELSIR